MTFNLLPDGEIALLDLDRQHRTLW
jgi:hypothetical protein